MKSLILLRLRLKHTAVALIAVTACASSIVSRAQTSATDVARPEQTDEKEIITVVVEAKADQPGAFTMSGSEINQAPSTSSTYVDAFRTKSSIQFDLNSRNSETAGDITPPRISIHGAKHYENNFLIDGISNNNNINPGSFQSNMGDSPGVAPAGESQSVFINPDLIGSITAYTSNVPASYGRFTGGVIDARLREARTDAFHGSMLYRYTSDAWADQRFAEGEDEGRTTSNSHQPRFRNYTFNANLEGPLSSHISGLLAYSENNSTRPVWDNTKPPVEYTNISSNKNFLLKLSSYGFSMFKAALTATYAPYESDMRIVSRRDSRSTSEGGGTTIKLDAEKIFSFATLTANAAYYHNDLNRIASNNMQYSWRNSASNRYANWGTSTTATATAQEGALGDYEQTKDNFLVKSQLAFNTFGPRYFRNTITVGGEVTAADVKRKTSGATLYMWNASDVVTKPGPLNTSAAGEKENGVIAGEQWLNRRSVYDPTDKHFTYTEATVYIDDVIKIERFTVRAGVRLDYEDIVGNTDIAPRLSVSADVFKNGLLTAFGGASRYYGTQLISAALYNNQGFRAETRKSWDAPWTLVSPASDSSATRRLGDLDTPYADELSLGAMVNVQKFVFRLEGIMRKERDQIRTMRDPLGGGAARVVTNSGQTDHEGLTFEATRAFDMGRAGKHELSLGATWSETKSNSRADDAFDEHDAGVYSTEWAWYNGEFVPTDNLPASNFNSPVVVTLKITSSLLNDRLRIFNGLRFDKGGDGLTNSTTPATIGPDGKRVYLYAERKYPNMFFWDANIEFDMLKYKDNTVTLMLNVNNILNRHYSVNSTLNAATDSTYTLGRQFRAAIQYKF